MCTPLKDRTGRVRYFLGAQVDVSGLAEELVGLEYLKQAAYGKPDDPRQTPLSTHYSTHFFDDKRPKKLSPQEGFKEFSEMLNDEELEIVRRHGGRMHHPEKDPSKDIDRRRLVLFPDDDDRGRDYEPAFRYAGLPEGLDDSLFDRPPTERSPSPVSLVSSVTSQSLTSGGYLGGIYENYVLVRPAPSLRILFASPSLRIPGLLQSSFLDRIGGPARIRDKVVQAFIEGQGVTANIRWIAKPGRSNITNHYGQDPTAGKPRWLHSTPLLSASRAVGVWMVVLVDDDSAPDLQTKRSGLQAPRGNGVGIHPVGMNGF